MKNIFVLILVAILVISCGSTKEIEEVGEDAPLVQTKQPEPQTMNREKHGESIDVDQLVAQLGLAEDQEELFLEMWYSTKDAMRKVRTENKGNKEALIKGLTEVKEQRIEGLERILTNDQLSMYYEIMHKNRGKTKGTVQKRKG